jgi:AbrB family looped-hinge helix DNA binding protein
MQTTKLSSKGQVIIPKILRSRYKWDIGQELTVIDTGEGILLKSSRPFKTTELDEVAGVLKYSGKPVSLDDMEKAIKKEPWSGKNDFSRYQRHCSPVNW